MTTPAEIQANFRAALEEFEINDEQPDVNYYEKMVRAMFDVLVDVPYDEVEGTHNLVGIILEDAPYTNLYGTAFEKPTRPKAVEEESDAGDAVTVGSRRKELAHAAKKADYKLYEAGVRGARNFIVKVVAIEWIAELKQDEMGFAGVEPIALLRHIKPTLLGTHETDIIKLQQQMQNLHVDYPRIPQYIQELQKLQRASKRCAGMPGGLTDAYLLAVATAAMIETERLPNADREFDDLEPDKRTWDKWKEIYKKADRKLAIKSAKGPARFGGAVESNTEESDQNGKPSAVDMDQLEGMFESLGLAVVGHKGDEISRLMEMNLSLVKSVAELTANNTNLTEQIKVLASARDEKPSGTGRPKKEEKVKKLCPNCNRVVFHKPDDCLELEKNKGKRRTGWKSVFDKE